MISSPRLLAAVAPPPPQFILEPFYKVVTQTISSSEQARPRRSMSSRIVACRPLSSRIVACRPLSSTIVACRPLSSTIVACRPLLPLPPVDSPTRLLLPKAPRS
eukprot:6179750-Pleurochrysis_carterae.AAC.1